MEWFGYEKDKNKIDVELKRRKIDKNKKTIIYTNGEVDKTEYMKYIDQGFKDLYCLKGGINEYSSKNKELERLADYERYVSTDWAQNIIDGNTPEGYNEKNIRL